MDFCSICHYGSRVLIDLPRNIRASREMLSKSYYIKPKSDCIYRFHFVWFCIYHLVNKRTRTFAFYINRNMISTIWFRFDLIWFRKDFSLWVCVAIVNCLIVAMSHVSYLIWRIFNLPSWCEIKAVILLKNIYAWNCAWMLEECPTREARNQPDRRCLNAAALGYFAVGQFAVRKKKPYLT